MDNFDVSIHYVTGFNHKGKTGFVIGWGCKDIGFGELTFSSEAKFDTNGFPDQTQWECDNELMSREFVKAVLAKLGDVVVLKTE